MPRLVKHCEQQDADRGTHDVSELILICERQQLSYDAVALARYRFEHGEEISLDFNTADRLLAGMRMWDAWYSDLREYYYNVDLTWRQCAHPSCAVMFQHHFVRCSFESCAKEAHARGLCHTHLERVSYHVRKEARALGVSTAQLLDERYPKTGHVGGSARREYCSHACAMSHGKQKKAGIEDGRRLKKYVPGRTCQQGHEMTPENTIITSNGHGHKTRCRCCFNAGRTAKRLAA